MDRSGKQHALRIDARSKSGSPDKSGSPNKSGSKPDDSQKKQ